MAPWRVGGCGQLYVIARPHFDYVVWSWDVGSLISWALGPGAGGGERCRLSINTDYNPRALARVGKDRVGA
eukprot:3565417-Prymnesium_polylepis.1